MIGVSDYLEVLTYQGLSQVVSRSVDEDALVESITLDDYGRVSELLWEDGDSVALEHFTYGYDNNGNVMFRLNGLNSDFSELYHENGAKKGYDLLNRMTHFYRGVLSDSSDPADGILDSVDSPTFNSEYDRDGAGNITAITTNGGSPVVRDFDKQNRLISHDGAGLTFDDVGNLVEADDDLIVVDDNDVDTASDTLGYDAWNRLVEFNADSDRYAYDALGRKTKQGASRFFFDMDGNAVEEHDGSGLKYQFVSSIADPSKLIARCEFDGTEIVETIFAITEIYYSVTAITTTEAEIIERFVYTPTGDMQILLDDWSEPEYENSSRDWAVGWQGGHLDAATQLIWHGTRAFSPTLLTSVTAQSVPSAITIRLPWWAIWGPSWLIPHPGGYRPIGFCDPADIAVVLSAHLEDMKTLQQMLDHYLQELRNHHATIAFQNSLDSDLDRMEKRLTELQELLGRPFVNRRKVQDVTVHPSASSVGAGSDWR